ncbi:hypothetical protein AB0D83_41655 [Streptomyces decoyicus]|uniref:hypothetical protein n=1 Tax=Streptomyces decoyicus TaxID=249567 RepID=UPI0033F038F1
MPNGRNHHQSPFWALESGAEIIMPPPTCDETLSTDVLTVTVPATLISAALTLPVLAAFSPTDSIAPAAVFAVCLKVAAGTQVSYQRIRRTITSGCPLPISVGE